MLPTLTALRGLGNDVVEAVLAENEGRWEALTERDRQRVEALANAIAKRLLHMPTAHVKSLDTGHRHARLQLLRELFGLAEPQTEAAEQPAEVRALRRP
jgi:glutamyl-tRNA reductase